MQSSEGKKTNINNKIIICCVLNDINQAKSNMWILYRHLGMDTYKVRRRLLGQNIKS